MAPTPPGQDPGTPDPAPGAAPAGLIWTRPPAEKRERPTREAIVATATGLADTHGLDAVSVRKVAAALNTRPMDLYRYFTRKDELIDLMVDEVIAGALLDEIPMTTGTPHRLKVKPAVRLPDGCVNPHAQGGYPVGAEAGLPVSALDP